MIIGYFSGSPWHPCLLKGNHSARQYSVLIDVGSLFSGRYFCLIVVQTSRCGEVGFEIWLCFVSYQFFRGVWKYFASRPRSNTTEESGVWLKRHFSLQTPRLFGGIWLKFRNLKHSFGGRVVIWGNTPWFVSNLQDLLWMKILTCMGQSFLRLKSCSHDHCNVSWKTKWISWQQNQKAIFLFTETHHLLGHQIPLE